MAVGPRPVADAESAAVEEEQDGEVGGGGGGAGFVESEVEVVFLVEEAVFTDGGAVVLNLHWEFKVVGAGNGAVAK